MNHLIQKKLSYLAASDVAKISCTLKQMGIHTFVHDITFKKGQIALLSDRKEIYEFYYQNA